VINYIVYKVRGGSWANHSSLCRSALRDYNGPDARNYNNGFRVVVGARVPKSIYYSDLTSTRRTKMSNEQAVTVDNFIDLGDGRVINIPLVEVPAGEFLMGSPEDEPGRWGDEGPQHRVKLDSFAMGVTLITQAQWEAVMGSNPSHFKGENNPVECISWEDAMEFCKRLSELTGDTYTLPTEEQWEYAARAGTNGRFYFGNDESKLKDHAWYCDNSENKTHPVAQLLPNPWGFFDILGNVWEWCLDEYDPEAYKKKYEKQLREEAAQTQA